MAIGFRWATGGALVASALLAMTIGAQPALASANSSTTNVKFPIQVALTVPCANGGAGETVFLSGRLNSLFHITVDNTGGLHVKSHNNPQAVRGVGLTTGAKYRGTGVTQQRINFGATGLPFTTTFVNNFRIIGQGPGNNFLVHEIFHITVNANGTVKAVVDNFRVTCK